MGYKSAAEARSMVVKWETDDGQERQRGPMTFGEALKVQASLRAEGVTSKIESVYAGLYAGRGRRAWR
jgi:hypothetical protein